MAKRSNSRHGWFNFLAMMRHASRHSMTRWLKSQVAALFARVKLLAITKNAFDGSLMGVALNGFHSINCAHPSCAKNAIAWSIPPPCVPIYRSQLAEMVDSSSLFRDNCSRRDENSIKNSIWIERLRVYLIDEARCQRGRTDQCTWTG